MRVAIPIVSDSHEDSFSAFLRASVSLRFGLQ
jgi:hypothetical protein